MKKIFLSVIFLFVINNLFAQSDPQKASVEKDGTDDLPLIVGPEVRVNPKDSLTLNMKMKEIPQGYQWFIADPKAKFYSKAERDSIYNVIRDLFRMTK